MQTFFCFLLLLSTSVCSQFEAQFNGTLEQVFKNGGGNTTCITQFQQFLEGIKTQQLWALKMIDADGDVPIGIFDGNFVDLGAFDECLSVVHRTNSSEILGKYCLGTLNMNFRTNFNPLVLEVINQFQKWNTSNRIMTAACIPSGCKAADIKHVYEVFGAGLVFNDELCQIKGEYSELGRDGILAIVLLSTLFVVVLFSTIMEFHKEFVRQENPHRYVQHFSLIQNGRTFLKPCNNSPHHLPCIQGIRLFSTLWLILNHKYLVDYAMIPSKNGCYKFESFPYAVVVLGNFSCDTFFLIGGLLVTYNYIKAKEAGLKFSLLKYYWLRYLRLTPALGAIILIYLGIFQHLGSGPLWPSMLQNYFVDGCEKNWWKALLYVQEFQPFTSICVLQTWYLSVDMQFYIFSPLLLIILAERPKFAMAVFGIISLCSTLLAFISGVILQINWNSSSNNIDAFYIDYYYAPEIRIGPWLNGLILGHLILNKQRDVFKFNMRTIRTLWCCSIILMLVCFLCAYNLYMGYSGALENAFNMAILRPLWTVSVGWIIFACISGYGGCLNAFLSLPIFQIFAKLTYCMYLSQFIVLFTESGQIKTVSEFSNYTEFTTYWFDVLWILLFSLFLHLFIEMPFRNFNRDTAKSIETREVNNETSPLIPIL